MDYSKLLLVFFDLNQGDVTLKFKNGNTRNVHKFVLEYNSPVFKTMLGNGMQESRDRIIPIPNFEEEDMLYLLKMMYGDLSILTKLGIGQLFEILRIADFYNCEALISLINKTLKDSIIESNLTEFSDYCHKYVEVSKEIQEKLFDVIKAVFDSVDKKEFEDFDNQDEQFNDHCYDLIKKERRTLSNNHKYCCKHKSIKKSFLEAEATQDGDRWCCISKKTITDAVSTRFCCQHRTVVVLTDQVEYIDKLKEEFNKKISKYVAIQNLVQKMPETQKLEFFEHCFYKVYYKLDK